MTGGESSYDDVGCRVDASVVGLILLEVGVGYFSRVVVGDPVLAYVVEGTERKDVEHCGRLR